MLAIKENVSLKSYNTFGLDVNASKVYFLNAEEQLESIPDRESALILGGGSNVLLVNDLQRSVIVNQLHGIKEISRSDRYVDLHVASGENWHDLVLYAVDKGYGGLENLSLIPGSVGAAPMQNIGAYGVEIKDVLLYVDALDLRTCTLRRFNNDQCEFGYRESIFKKRAKNKYFISAIGLRLSLNNHKLNTSYGAIQDTLTERGIEHPGIKDISDAVIAIRQSKLPDPAKLGNSGSFFKNPVISKKQFEDLSMEFPDIRSYPVDDHNVKVPAGWLIESLGWKGKVVGQTGSHKDQALVLVNYGAAKGDEIKALSEEIKQSVANTYGIQLETEVNIIES